MFDKIVRRLGMKDDTGWDDPTVVGFVVLWSIFLTGFYFTVEAFIGRFF
tara:strand:- start:588 stop:734 length:147 start_codon:yes stop_codon:yes gene_type:complete